MRHLAVAFCLLAGASPVTAADPPCSAAEHRQFDFWVGTWEVTLPDGTVAGRNEITSVLGGCALSEHWRGARGLEGFSLNAYDAATDTWHQTWIDSAGARLALSGGLQGNAMVMGAEDQPTPGATHGRRQRITWTPGAGGSVRQHWETSEDGGASWKTVFDGTYRRAVLPSSSAGVGAGRGAPAAPAPAEQAIRALVERTEAANNAGDVGTWVGLFAEDAIYLPPGAPAVTTRDGLVAVAEAGFRHRAAVTIDPVEVVVAGDWAYARNEVGGSVQLHGTGEIVSVDLDQIVIYRRDTAGEWKIARLVAHDDGE